MKLSSIQQYKAQLASVLSSYAIESIRRDTESLADSLAVCRTVLDPQLTRPIDYFQAQLMQLRVNEHGFSTIDFDTAFKLRRKFFDMNSGLEKIGLVLNASLRAKVIETVHNISKNLDDVFFELCVRDNQHHENMRVFRDVTPGLFFVNWNIEFADSSKYFTEPCTELAAFTHIHIRHPNIDILHHLTTPMHAVVDLIHNIHKLTEQSKSTKQMSGIGCDINELEVEPKNPHCLIVFIKSEI